MSNFSIGREKRENHPDKEKAVLYETIDGQKVKIGVWKPKCSKPKLTTQIPMEVYEALKKEKETIEKEELLKN